MIAVQIGVEPMAAMVPTATPVFGSDEKNNNWKPYKHKATNTRNLKLKEDQEFGNFFAAQQKAARPKVPITILASVTVNGVAASGAKLWIVPEKLKHKAPIKTKRGPDNLIFFLSLGILPSSLRKEFSFNVMFFANRSEQTECLTFHLRILQRFSLNVFQQL